MTQVFVRRSSAEGKLKRFLFSCLPLCEVMTAIQLAKYDSLANVENAVIHLGMNKTVLNTSFPFQILCLCLQLNIPAWSVWGVSPFFLFSVAPF